MLLYFEHDHLPRANWTQPFLHRHRRTSLYATAINIVSMTRSTRENTEHCLYRNWLVWRRLRVINPTMIDLFDRNLPVFMIALLDIVLGVLVILDVDLFSFDLMRKPIQDEGLWQQCHRRRIRNATVELFFVGRISYFADANPMWHSSNRTMGDGKLLNTWHLRIFRPFSGAVDVTQRNESFESRGHLHTSHARHDIPRWVMTIEVFFIFDFFFFFFFPVYSMNSLQLQICQFVMMIGDGDVLIEAMMQNSS